MWWEGGRRPRESGAEKKVLGVTASVYKQHLHLEAVFPGANYFNSLTFGVLICSMG